MGKSDTDHSTTWTYHLEVICDLTVDGFVVVLPQVFPDIRAKEVCLCQMEDMFETVSLFLSP